VLASFRAELLVLRKWPAAWVLLLLTRMLMLASYYVASLIQYVTLTPAEYGWAGTPAQQLPAMLPSQFVIIAVTQFQLSGVVPFIVLGAIVAGDDWGRGTIRTSPARWPPGYCSAWRTEPSA
jgi:ABC-2 type transport system permease protein